jgi:hypothetical protein
MKFKDKLLICYIQVYRKNVLKIGCYDKANSKKDKPLIINTLVKQPKNFSVL